jgi:hypothetical protein
MRNISVLVGTALLTIVGSSQAAPPMPPQVQAAVALVGNMEMPRIMKDICTAKAPASADENSSTYSSWAERHAEALATATKLLAQYEAKLSPLLSAFSEGNIAGIQGISTFAEGIVRQTAQSQGDAYMADVCSTFPAFLANLDKNFEKRLSEQQNALVASFR